MKKVQHGRTRTLICSVCDDTWETTNIHEIESSLVSPFGCRCAACVYIDMAARHAAQRGISLRRAVKGYLHGTAKRRGVSEESLWKGIDRRASSA